MVDAINPVHDIFGLGRLSQSIRQNRADKAQKQLAEQNAITRGLQQEGLRLGIQEKKQGIADLETGRQSQLELQNAIGQDTGESQTLKAVNFLKTKNPQAAQKIIGDTLEIGGKMSELNAQGGIDFVNSELGTTWKLDAEDKDTMTIDQGDKKVLINKGTGKIIKEFPVTKPDKQLTPQQEAFSRLTPEQQAATFLKSNQTIEMTKDGGFRMTTGTGKGVKPKKFSDVQSKSGGFADRVQRSNKISNDLEDTEGFDPAEIGESIATNIPLIGNALLSPERQKYEQSKRDFVSAVLRLESGAAIAQSEFDSANKLYFPQVGDSPEVIAQKRASRNFQFDILKAAGGGAFENIQEQRGQDTDKVFNFDAQGNLTQ